MNITTVLEYQTPIASGVIVLTDLGAAFTANQFQPVIGDKIPFEDLSNVDAQAINNVAAGTISIIVNHRIYSILHDELVVTFICVPY